ncbi:MAG: hypothetical protein Q9222_002803 [Ikaeria aurantiellina]
MITKPPVLPQLVKIAKILYRFTIWADQDKKPWFWGMFADLLDVYVTQKDPFFAIVRHTIADHKDIEKLLQEVQKYYLDEQTGESLFTFVRTLDRMVARAHACQTSCGSRFVPRKELQSRESVTGSASPASASEDIPNVTQEHLIVTVIPYHVGFIFFGPVCVKSGVVAQECFQSGHYVESKAGPQIGAWDAMLYRYKLFACRGGIIELDLEEHSLDLPVAPMHERRVLVSNDRLEDFANKLPSHGRIDDTTARSLLSFVMLLDQAVKFTVDCQLQSTTPNAGKYTSQARGKLVNSNLETILAEKVQNLNNALDNWLNQEI